MDKVLRQQLKAQAHHLNPVILLGAKGLTEAVIAETDRALDAHELIKVKMKGLERADREELSQTLCQSLGAELVQMIGAIAIIYRKKPDEK